MALSWMERLKHFVGLRPKYATWDDIPELPEYRMREVTLEDVERSKIAEKPKTEFEKIIDDFNFRTDMIVMSYSKYSALSQGEKDWLDSLGKKVHYFKDNSLVNISIVRAY